MCDLADPVTTKLCANQVTAYRCSWSINKMFNLIRCTSKFVIIRMTTRFYKHTLMKPGISLSTSSISTRQIGLRVYIAFIS